MISRAEASRIKEEFWTAFGRYMRPIPSVEGLKVNWVNYHTGIKDVYFRMHTGNRMASIAISLEHNDQDLLDLYFQQFLEFKSILHATLEEEWIWQSHTTVDGKAVSRIYKELPGGSVLNREHWPDLISFFKPRIIALDTFWADAKYSFETLK